MKKLKKGVKKAFYKDGPKRSKDHRAFYIGEDQIEAIEEISNGKASEYLRNVLDRLLAEKGILMVEVALIYLRKIHHYANSEALKEAALDLYEALDKGKIDFQEEGYVDGE